MDTLGCHLDEWVLFKGLLYGPSKGHFAIWAIIPSVISLSEFHNKHCHVKEVFV